MAPAEERRLSYHKATLQLMASHSLDAILAGHRAELNPAAFNHISDDRFKQTARRNGYELSLMSDLYLNSDRLRPL